MKRLLVAALALHLLACASSTEEGVPDRMIRPLFVATDRTDRLLTYILDSARSSVFAWDGYRRAYVTGRAPGPLTPPGYVGIAMGTDSRLDKLDAVFKGFAVAPTGAAMAALYSYGFEDRTGYLAVVTLGTFPVVPGTNRTYFTAPDAIGPFATPDDRFVVVEPASPTQARWAAYPGPTTAFTGPNVTRMVFTLKGDRVYAADAVNERIHVFTWPAMLPVTTITVSGRPIDLALHPRTNELAVVTSRQLVIYSPPPTFAAARSIPQDSMPIRVAFDRNHWGANLAVLNQNTTLSFYDSATLCAHDVDDNGFEVEDSAFFDEGAFSDPALSEVTPAGCPSQLADQIWRVTYEGRLEAGAGKMLTADAVTGVTLASGFVQAGDTLFVGKYAARITAVTAQALYFTALTAPPAPATPVTFAVYAAGAWVVAGESEGLIGRVKTGEVFKTRLHFAIAGGAAPPTRGDAFSFVSRNNVTPIFLGGVPGDMAQDRFGRFVVTIPQNQEARAVNIKQLDGQWVIRTLYVIP